MWSPGKELADRIGHGRPTRLRWRHPKRTPLATRTQSGNGADPMHHPEFILLCLPDRDSNTRNIDWPLGQEKAEAIASTDVQSSRAW
jgi:hypothetical protein